MKWGTIALAALSAPFAAQHTAPPVPIFAPPPPPMPVAPERLAAAEKLVRALQIEAQYDLIFAQMIPLLTRQIFDSISNNVNLPAELRKRLADPDELANAQRRFAANATKGLKARYARLVRATATEYAREFTVEELGTLVAFYETPLGQKVLKVQPDIQRRLFPIGEAAGLEVGIEAMQEVLEHLDSARPQPKT